MCTEDSFFCGRIDAKEDFRQTGLTRRREGWKTVNGTGVRAVRRECPIAAAGASSARRPASGCAPSPLRSRCGRRAVPLDGGTAGTAGAGRGAAWAARTRTALDSHVRRKLAQLRTGCLFFACQSRMRTISASTSTSGKSRCRAVSRCRGGGVSSTGAAKEAPSRSGALIGVSFSRSRSDSPDGSDTLSEGYGAASNRWG